MSTDRQDGAAAITAERRRQVTEEGYTAEHDAQHAAEEFVRAAAAYLIPGRLGYLWPWPLRFFRPTSDHRRDLVRAGALIAAAIDRLDAESAKAYQKHVMEL